MTCSKTFIDPSLAVSVGVAGQNQVVTFGAELSYEAHVSGINHAILTGSKPLEPYPQARLIDAETL